jgi:hypothetical protein
MDKSELEALLARIDVWLLVFGIIVVVGVAGESFFGIRHWWNSRKLKVLQDKENADQAAEISRLRTAAAEALRQAADANRMAEQERLARIKIEETLAWRRISPGEYKALVSALRPHAGASVQVLKLGDMEAATFADDLIKTLRDSGWLVNVESAEYVVPIPYGLQCSIDGTIPAGRALAEVLKALPTAQIRSVSGSPPVARIVVGLRPPP